MGSGRLNGETIGEEEEDNDDDEDDEVNDGDADAPSDPESEPDTAEEGGKEDNAEDFCSLVGVWERTKSRSRATMTETVDIRFHDWEHARRPERLLVRCIQLLLDRALAGRSSPLRIGMGWHPPGWDAPYYVPLRSPEQNTASAIAAELEAFAKQYEAIEMFGGAVRFKITAVWPLGKFRIREGVGVYRSYLVSLISHRFHATTGRCLCRQF